MPSASTPRFTARHMALGRAAAAAIAALMITFSGDHSAPLGLSVFSGFAIMTALVWAIGAWLVVPVGQRTTPFAMAFFSGIVGIVGGAVAYRTPALLFSLVIAWALFTGVLELIQGLRARATDPVTARDQITVAALTLLLAVVTAILPLVPDQSYFNAEVNRQFTMTSTIIAVGLFGAYAAIIAVYIGIAALSPAKSDVTAPVQADATASGKADND